LWHWLAQGAIRARQYLYQRLDRAARLDPKWFACEFTASLYGGLPPLTRSEIWRIEKYLRNLFRLDTITLVERPKQDDSVEVHIGGEFIGVIFRDEEDGDLSYAFNMAILEMDLPEAPSTRAG
jgi:hypothetical protein